jgi:hypothetical protein
MSVPKPPRGPRTQRPGTMSIRAFARAATMPVASYRFNFAKAAPSEV